MQKEMTDQELKDEIMARRDAEKRLKNAEESLARLEAALKEREGIESQQKEQKKLEKSLSENEEFTSKRLERMRTSSAIEEDISASVADLKSMIINLSIRCSIGKKSKLCDRSYYSSKNKSTCVMYIQSASVLLDKEMFMGALHLCKMELLSLA